MYREDLVQKIKSVTPEELANHGILSNAKASGYVCPHCLNGSGDDGTGIDFQQVDDTFLAKCYKCGEGFDIIKILALHYNLDYKDKQDFKLLLARANQEFFGADAPNFRKKSNQKKADKSQQDFKLGSGFFPQLTSKYYFDLGLTPPSWGKLGLPYFIIPTSKNHYFARLTISEDEAKKIVGENVKIKPKPHHGEIDLFLLDDLKKAKDSDTFFLVEGPFDALSIKKVGFKAISSWTADISAHILEQLAGIKTKPRIIVLLDTDTTGILNTAKVVRNLRELDYNVTSAYLPTKITKPDSEVVRIKDANEFLLADEAQFKNFLLDLIKSKQDTFEQTAFEQGGFENKTSRQVFTDCPADVKIPHGFYLGKRGIYKIFETQDMEKITSTPIFVSKVLCNQDGKDYQAEICFKSRRKGWKSFTTPLSELYDSRTYGRNFCERGIPLTSKSASRLSAYLVAQIDMPENIDRISEDTYYSKTGWIDGKFIYPGKDCKVVNGGFDYDEAFAVKGERQALLDMVLEGFYSSSAARLTLGAVFTAPLVDALGCRNLQFHLAGTSGSGKTTFLKLAFGCFGNPFLLYSSFNSTVKHIHQRAAWLNHLPNWLDEMQHVHPKDRPFIARNYIYPFEEGKTTGRLTKDITERPTVYFRGTRITTSEDSITEYVSEQGALNRVLEIDAKNIISPQFAKKIIQFFAKTPSYGHLGREFIEKLTPDRLEKLAEMYEKLQLEIKYKALVNHGFTGSIEEVEDIPDYATGINPHHIPYYAAAYTALYAFGMTFMKDNDLSNTLKTLIAIDIDEILAKSAVTNETSNAERFLPVIQESLISLHSRFGIQRSDGKVMYNEQGAMLGIIGNDDTIYFNAQEINNYLKSQGAFATRDIWRGLHDFGALIEDNDKNHKYKKYMYFKTTTDKPIEGRFYALKAHADKLIEEAKARQVRELMNKAYRQAA